jgi:hypothetical protein
MSRTQPLSAVCGLTWKDASSPEKIAGQIATAISAAARTIAGATNTMFAG